jgi:hypothetical protein
VAEMVSFILALVLWFVDPYLGIVAAVSFPAIVSLDTTDYTDVGVAFFIALGFWFAQRAWGKER